MAEKLTTDMMRGNVEILTKIATESLSAERVTSLGAAYELSAALVDAIDRQTAVLEKIAGSLVALEHHSEIKLRGA